MPQHHLPALCHAGRLIVGSPDRGRAWEGCASTRSPSQRPLALAVVEKVFRKPCIEQGLPIAAIPECKEQAFVDKNMDFELGDGMRKGEDTKVAHLARQKTETFLRRSAGIGLGRQALP